MCQTSAAFEWRVSVSEMLVHGTDDAPLQRGSFAFARVECRDFYGDPL